MAQKETDSMKFETVIGLETHAQLLTASKMFCSCSTKFGSNPNTNICPVCTGQPGTLPVVNKKAIEFAIKMALALHCTINLESIFARKNYFYPDLPKNYQISQFEKPLAENGYLEIEVNGEFKKIGITRIHLEEDAGKLNHKGSVGLKGADHSLVDLNRTGTPLMEIVSEPDMRTAQEARIYMEELAHILEYLEVCDAKLEEGSVRCDANVSIRPFGETKLGVKTEVKNLNSFKSVEKAIEKEYERQENALATGEEIFQASLLFDETTNSVSIMRRKEGSSDYRYFPDPDLLPLVVTNEMINEIRKELPELPIEKYKRFVSQYGIPGQDAEVLVATKELSIFFEETVKILNEPKLISNWLISDISAYLNANDCILSGTKITPSALAEMISLIKAGTIGGKTAKDVIIKILETGASPKELVESMGATQISDESALLETVKQIIADNQASVDSYKSGKVTAIKFLIGQAMKATKGRGNPTVIEQLFVRELGERP